jgi:arylsulfatase A-like enzyme
MAADPAITNIPQQLSSLGFQMIVMNDIVLVTADSVRYDYADEMSFISSTDVLQGVTAAHYTRPSLAALHSSNYLAAARTQPIGTTLAEILSAAGYTCIGLAPTPQMDPAFGFDAGFDYYENFYEGDGNAVERRTSRFREFFGQFDTVRRIYRQFNPMGAVLDDIPDDEDLIDEAIKQFNDATSPRFLWIHLMESHRPYGTGDEAVPVSLDRKAETLGGDGLLSRRELNENEKSLIDEKYRDALSRCDAEIRRLVESLDADPTFVFTSDHGEELGEEGYYYHQGYRRRVPETITRVPTIINGIEIDAERCGLVDIATTLVSAQNIEPPTEWHGIDLAEREPESTLTIAPWHKQATVLWQDFKSQMIFRDTTVDFRMDDIKNEISNSDVSERLEQRLKNLGYMDAG